MNWITVLLTGFIAYAAIFVCFARRKARKNRYVSIRIKTLKSRIATES